MPGQNGNFDINSINGVYDHCDVMGYVPGKDFCSFFRDRILGRIRPEPYEALVPSGMERSPEKVRMLVGAVLFAEEERISIDDLGMRLRSDVSFQYALGLNMSDAVLPDIGTLWAFQDAIREQMFTGKADLLRDTRKELTGILCRELDITVGRSVGFRGLYRKWKAKKAAEHPTRRRAPQDREAETQHLEEDTAQETLQLTLW